MSTLKPLILRTLCAVAVFWNSPVLAEFPERGLEFVAGYKPGGGHDTLLRSMAKILREEGIVQQPITVVNKPGGSSAVSMGYLNGKKGDGHYLMSITSSHITTPLNSNIGLDYASFTPIARLGIDPELLVVNPSGPYKSVERQRVVLNTLSPFSLARKRERRSTTFPFRVMGRLWPPCCRTNLISW